MGRWGTENETAAGAVVLHDLRCCLEIAPVMIGLVVGTNDATLCPVATSNQSLESGILGTVYARALKKTPILALGACTSYTISALLIRTRNK